MASAHWQSMPWVKNNKDKINYNFLALNPSIFTIDYEKIKRIECRGQHLHYLLF